jgi:hypothetical protein
VIRSIHRYDGGPAFQHPMRGEQGYAYMSMAIYGATIARGIRSTSTIECGPAKPIPATPKVDLPGSTSYPSD